MKKTAFNIIMSILLILAGLAALGAGAWGGLECYALKKLEKELPTMSEKIKKLDDAINLLKDKEDVYLDGVELCYQGDAKLLQGRRVIDDGKSQLSEGKELLKEAQAQYDEGKAQLAEGKAQLAEAKAQMEEARPQYEEGKELLGKLERLQPLLATYVQLKNGVLVNIEGFNTVNAWYRAVAIPAAAALGLTLPSDADSFAAYMDEQIAQGNAALAEYEAAEAQLADAQKQIDEGEEKLAEAKKVLDGKYKEVDAAGDKIKDAEGQLSVAAGKLAEGKASLGEFEEAVAKVEETVATLLKTESINNRNGDVAVKGVSDRLGKDFDIYKYNEEGELLSLTGGNPRLDYDKCLKVSEAYREYIKDYTEDVSREAASRIALDSLLLACGVLAIVSAIKALRGKASAVKLSVILTAVLLLMNIFGIVVGYTAFAHPQSEDIGEAYTGILPVFGIWLLTIVSAVFMLSCLRGRRLAAKAEEPPAPETEDTEETPVTVPAAEEVSVPVTVPATEENPTLQEKTVDDAKREYEEALRRYVEMREKLR